MLETIIALDRTLAALLSGGDHAFLDAWAVLLTSTLCWVPLFCALVVMVVKNNEKLAQILAVFVAVGIGALFTLALDNLVVKPAVARLRPFADPELAGLVTIVRGYTAEGFSFFSAHASNTMALAVFASLLVRNRAFTLMMLLYSAVNCWTRLYLGVHFASDVAVGALWGALVAVGVFYLVYKPLYRRVSAKLHFISSAYTKMGYAYTDIDRCNAVAALTYIVTAIIACAQALQ